MNDLIAIIVAVIHNSKHNNAPNDHVFDCDKVAEEIAAKVLDTYHISPIKE